MSDYLIRRQEMGEAIDRIRLDLKHETFYSFYQKALMALNEVPTVDAVPVVRCLDCKYIYCRTYQGGQDPIYTCTHFRKRWNTDFDLQVNPDDFCSYGEGREE